MTTRYSHIHTRVFATMVDFNVAMSKSEIARAAFTTENVVANAFYDIRRGIRTPDGTAYDIEKIREVDENGKGVYKYRIADPTEVQLELAL